MKKRLIPVLLLVLLVLLSACSKPKLDPVMSNTPAPEEEQTATATPASVTPTPAPATPTPAPVTELDPVVEISDAGFDERYKKASFVLLGTIEDDGVEWNSCRDKDDESKPNPTVFMMDMSFKFKVTECLKGNLKAGDVIKYNLFYREKYPGDSDYSMNDTYLAPEKGHTYLIFMEQDPTFTDTYYVDTEPHCFELKDDKLYIYTLLDIKDKWGDGQGMTGVSYASAKLEMGIKQQ